MKSEHRIVSYGPMLGYVCRCGRKFKSGEELSKHLQNPNEEQKK